jgi:hypothetical protein
MALYEGLKRAARESAEATSELRFSSGWRRLEARVQAGRGAAPLMDRLLGAGASQTLRRALGVGGGAGVPRSSAALPSSRRSENLVLRRVQAVGSGQQAVPRGRKGLIRGLLAAAGLLWAVLALRPWQLSGRLNADVAALFRLPSVAGSAASERFGTARVQAERESREEAARLAALPLELGRGRARALWRDGQGRWYGVDGDGRLLESRGPGAKENLGLVELTGCRALAEKHGKVRRLRLDLPRGRLDELLPLLPALASEAATLDLSDPNLAVLTTYEGTRCLLPVGDFARAQRRLALVLADLAARRRRAAQIDLRYEDSAVVKPAS